MKEYIEREALLSRMEERLNSLRKEYGNYDHYTDGFEEGCIAVEDADAADVVEVVRCKDCVWFAPNNGGLWYGCAFDTRHPDDVPKPDDFCSSGERRADDGKT